MSLIKAFIVINLVMVAFAYTTWLERKLLGRMQLRYGPNRAGPFGLLAADRRPASSSSARNRSSRPPRRRFPTSSRRSSRCFTALAAFSVIPSAQGWTIDGYYVGGAVVNVPISLILIFALGSIGIYGFIVAGWASDSKYSMLGSMRTCAQLVSYEVSLALSACSASS